MSSRNVTAYALIVLGALLMVAGGALAFPIYGPLSIVPDWTPSLFDRGIPDVNYSRGGNLRLIEFVVACMPGLIVTMLGRALREPAPRDSIVAEGGYRTEIHDYEKRHPGSSARRAGAAPSSPPDPDR